MNELLARSSGFLFSSYPLSDALQHRLDAVKKEVTSMNGERFLNTSPTDLVQYLVEKYSLELPKLCLDEMRADSKEIHLDISIIPGMGHLAVGTQQFPAQRFEIEIPFDGDEDLFYALPSVHDSHPPRGIVDMRLLHIVINVLHNSPHHDTKGDFEKQLATVEQWLQWIGSDLSSYHRGLAQLADRAITERRERLLLHAGRAASLGIPFKARIDSPQTYVLPQICKKVFPSLPAASKLPYQPEPALDLKQYDEILSMLQGMTLTMERSPSAFRTIGEEDIRQHFLFCLNGQFEGRATAETFNVNGKTDILIREGDRNVFIAECKFWKGAKHYLESIDQLLGYKAWRDTKTAILVFNRGIAMSTVCEAVEQETVKHPNFKRQDPWRRETGYRYVFHHTGDANREFLLTVLVFDVPGPNESTRQHE